MRQTHKTEQYKTGQFLKFTFEDEEFYGKIAAITCHQDKKILQVITHNFVIPILLDNPRVTDIQVVDKIDANLYGALPMIDKCIEHRQTLPTNFYIQLTKDNVYEFFVKAYETGYEVGLPHDMEEVLYMSGRSIHSFILYSILREEVDSLAVFSVGGSPLLQIAGTDKFPYEATQLDIETFTQ